MLEVRNNIGTYNKPSLFPFERLIVCGPLRERIDAQCAESSRKVPPSSEAFPERF
jgi:hypothetical protein